MNMSVEEYLIVICFLVAVLIYNKIKNSLPSQYETEKCEDKNKDDKDECQKNKNILNTKNPPENF